ncbi:unnamed protein product [Orchesella dallaii]|uniref:Uncharacterized protein n=1 Tax=Orchesella dallaii TaxID=48710 RepID=A0ABP1Q7C4_9HEXA
MILCICQFSFLPTFLPKYVFNHHGRSPHTTSMKNDSSSKSLFFSAIQARLLGIIRHNLPENLLNMSQSYIIPWKFVFSGFVLSTDHRDYKQMENGTTTTK